MKGGKNASAKTKSGSNIKRTFDQKLTRRKRIREVRQGQDRSLTVTRDIFYIWTSVMWELNKIVNFFNIYYVY